MSVMSRVNTIGQMRLDLSDLLASESFTAFDFRTLITSFVGGNAYVLRGLSATSKNGLTLYFGAANSITYNPLDGNGSFYLGLPDDNDIAVTLPDNQANVYIEAKFTNETTAPVSKAFWDPLALSGSSASGTEFSASTNSQSVMVLSVTANTSGFTEGSIKLAKATTQSGVITSMTDCRPLMFRLGTGGNQPDPQNKYEWSTSRGEAVSSGAGVGDAVDSSWRSRDSIGALNDKGIQTLKEWMDAVMTRISEIAGTSLWYQTSSSSGAVANVSLSQMFFDTLGSKIQSSSNATLIWKRVGGNLVLASEGYEAGGPHTDALVQWQSNNSALKWQLGGTFVNNIPGGSRSYATGQYRFTSPSPVDGGNIYLAFEREVSKGSGANVLWQNNSSYAGFLASNAVSGNPGDFTGVAVGDYIRKESEGYSRYYKVTRAWDGSSIINTDNYVCSSAVICLEVANIVNPSLGIVGSPSSEPLIYFRSHYSSNDVVADTVAGTYSFQDANFLWLGRRTGNLFMLKDYGTMQENEEVPIMDDSFKDGSSGISDIVMVHSNKAIYDATNGYSLKTGSGDLVTIYRRKRDNTTETPSSGDNSGSLLAYTIAAPVGVLTVNQSLWVRLSDSISGALTPGNVVDPTDDATNLDTNTNHYQILDAIDAPLRTYDNRDVFLLARKEIINSQECLVFFDGKVVGPWGQTIHQDLEIYGDLKLTEQPVTAIPVIDPTTSGLVINDSTQFFYNKNTQIFGAQNFRINGSNIALGTPDSVNFVNNIGSNTLTIGGASSTTFIPGDLMVAGNVTGVQTSELLVDDKLITLGIGDLNNGGYDAGVEVADNTYSATNLATTNGSADVVITLPSSPGYLVGNKVGISSDDTIGGITAGQISGQYTIVASLVSAGDATISGPTLTVRTSGSATSTASGAPTKTRVFKSEWAVKVSNSDGSSGGITSWSFTVKNQVTKPTITPVLNYGTIPTANSVNMQATLIPFVNDDNAGPGGADSTIDFDSNLSWNNTSKNLNVGQSLSVGVFEDFIQQGSYVTAPSAGSTRVWAEDDYYLYQRTDDGNIQALTPQNGNVYEEVVDVVLSPSGNNQTAPISVPTVIPLPKDTKKLIGIGLSASTTVGLTTVVVKKHNHGLSTGEVATISTGSAIGGISAVNLSVTTAVTLIDLNTFSYSAGAVAISSASGNLDNVHAISTRGFIVGDSSLAVLLNNVQLTSGLDYTEVGAPGSFSSSITMLSSLVVGDTLVFRIDSNGGLVLVNMNGGTTLQAAYNAGSTVTVGAGSPLTISGPSGQKLLAVTGDVQIDGIIDPTGMVFTPQASDPLSAGDNGLWVNNSGELMYRSPSASPVNLSKAVESGAPIADHQDYVQQSAFPAPPSAGNSRVWAEDDYYLYQRTPDGNVQILTPQSGNVYEEVVDVVLSPSGNNQTAPISVPTSISLPKDTRKLIGIGLAASVTSGSAVVTVSKRNHGLSTGEIATISTTSWIGGISPSSLSISTAVNATDPNHFTYVASSAATLTTSGSLDMVKAVSTRGYVVGDGSLKIYLNNVQLTPGHDYNENGPAGSFSNSITMNAGLVASDVLVYRIDANGGLVMLNSGGGSSTLQSAYNLGNTIAVSSGAPVTISGPGGQKLLTVHGDIQVDGVVDPTAVSLTPVSSDPLTPGSHGLWVNTSGDLIFKAGVSAPLNISTAAEAAAGRSMETTWAAASGNTLTVTHNWGTRFVMVEVLDSSDSYATINLSVVQRPTDNTVYLVATQAPSVSWVVLLKEIV